MGFNFFLAIVRAFYKMRINQRNGGIMERQNLDTIIMNLENRISDLEIEFHMVVKNVESVLRSVVNQMKQVDRAMSYPVPVSSQQPKGLGRRTGS